MLRPRRQLTAVVAMLLFFSACSDGDDDTTASPDDAASAITTTTLVATSSSVAPSTDSQPSTDTTTTTMEPTTTETTASTVDTPCSASGVDRPEPQVGLPTAVADKREAILTAALACDIEGLAALTGPSFTASFGGGEPAAIWIDDEYLFGYEPMRALVELLRLTPTVIDLGSDGVRYTWPPAFTYETWAEVPLADRDALRVLYDDADFDVFAQFGSYIGYRTSITDDGTWTAFVGGD